MAGRQGEGGPNVSQVDSEDGVSFAFLCCSSRDHAIIEDLLGTYVCPARDYRYKGRGFKKNRLTAGRNRALHLTR